jgi:hypothetical protein
MIAYLRREQVQQYLKIYDFHVGISNCSDIVILFVWFFFNFIYKNTDMTELWYIRDNDV